MKIKTSGHQTFNVPNDEDGRKFLEMVRRYRNKGWTYRALGRGPRSAPEGVFDPHFGSPNHIRQSNSKWMALYMHSNRGATFNTVLSAIRDTSETVYPPVGPAGPPVEVVNHPMAIDCQIAEWSNPIFIGDWVARDGDGRVFAEAIHGMGAGQEHLGIAMANMTGGLIGEGEAIVQVGVGAPPVLADNPPVSGWVRPASARKPEDTTELTPGESELLEEIIVNASLVRAMRPESERKLMDSLVNKLVD